MARAEERGIQRDRDGMPCCHFKPRNHHFTEQANIQDGCSRITNAALIHSPSKQCGRVRKDHRRGRRCLRLFQCSVLIPRRPRQYQDHPQRTGSDWPGSQQEGIRRHSRKEPRICPVSHAYLFYPDFNVHSSKRAKPGHLIFSRKHRQHQSRPLTICRHWSPRQWI